MDKSFALSLLTYFGIPWRNARPEEFTILQFKGTGGISNSWNGTELVLTSRRTGEQICHEVCHWLVSSIEERKLPEFGLGSAPYIDVGRTEEHIKSKREDYEILTCLLEIYIFKITNRHWKSLARSLDFALKDESVIKTGKIDFERFVRLADNFDYWKALKRRKLISKIDKWMENK